MSAETATALPDSVLRPAYDRQAQASGIVHFGIGAFHRAHQAVYTDDAMAAGDGDWAISGVSLRSPDVRDQMVPQDGLFTVAERSGAGTALRLIGSVRNVLVAPEAPDAVIAALAAPETRIVTLTITEKGYRPPESGSSAKSVYDFLASGLARRRAAGLPGLTLISCDNLADNGSQLATLLGGHLDRVDPALAAWFRAECACPSTMVDRIVPATTAADRTALEAAIGMRDEAAVQTEPFRQWVIEDRFAGDRPRWEAGGAQFVAHVRPYEIAKLRMLNGAHSALAYLGLARGHVYVHQAMADPELSPLIDQLMRREAAPSVEAGPGHDLMAYADDLVARFANPALEHRLIQIAMDGSQKIPQRWLETLAWHQQRGSDCPAILSALAAWIGFVRGDAHSVDDPMAERLAALWREAGVQGIVEALVGPNGMFAASWVATDADRAFLNARVANADAEGNRP
jgi:fructuronate reductase